MKTIKKCSLTTEQLRRMTDLEAFDFQTTEDLPCLGELIGQERAVRSMAFGLEVKSKGYNIFVLGEPGSGRTTYTLEKLREKAKGQKAPDDWIYVYNFDIPNEPLAISLPAGKAKELATAVEELVEELKQALSKAFDNSQYEDNKAQLVKEFQERVNGLMEDLRAWSKEQGFAIKRTPQGFVNIPIVREEDEEGNGTEREMQQEEFEALEETEQKRLQQVSEQVSQKTLEVLRSIRDEEKELKERIRELEAEICRNALQPYLSDLKDRFADSGGETLKSWIESLAEDIIANFGMFVAAARDENAETDFTRYSVNVLVSNHPDQGAAVVWETNPTYYNLVGKVEYESRQGYLYTDFKKIVGGAIHRANGGYLVLDAEQFFRQFMTWDALKRVLRTGELNIENLGEQLGFVPVSSLRPQAIPIDMKVVIIGTRFIYHLLTLYDPDFQKLFKIKADYDVDMPRSAETEKQLACFIASYVSHEGQLPFDKSGVGEVIEWASRLAGQQDRMSTQFNRLAEIIVEASAWAVASKASQVSREHVVQAIDEKIFRSNLIEERFRRAFEEGTIRVDTEGKVVGQINGLTVIDLRDHAFGHPVRITANVFMGQEGIVNIEREVKMTGPIHNKGLLTLSSYLGRTYAQDMPLSLSARIAFEQTYSGIEGDSASSTELYCLLSALSDLPLRQDIAVTGSVDQFGMIQPIGGVNEKVEGFFDYCRVKGLTGTQGVLIPVQNVKDLMLKWDVVKAVKEGQFNLWAVSTVDEGIEILTGKAAGKAQFSDDDDRKALEKTVHGRVRLRLQNWFRRSAELKKLLGGKDNSDGKNDNFDEQARSH